MSFNKFDIRTNLKDAQNTIFESEKLLKEGSCPRLILYRARIEISNALDFLNENPEYCPG